jgi:hypothetical protein
MQTFPVKDPGESVDLTFNMASNLPTSVVLNGSITVVVSVLEGVDPNPSAILNGSAGLDSTLTQVVQPVTQGVSGVLYEVKVTAATTLPTIVLVLAGALPVRNAQ